MALLRLIWNILKAIIGYKEEKAQEATEGTQKRNQEVDRETAEKKSEIDSMDCPDLLNRLDKL